MDDLKEAVLEGNERTLKNTIQENPFLVHVPFDDDDTTLLHLAAACNDHPSISTILIEKGASTNAQNRDGLTPLHVAAMNACTRTIRVLLDNGADPSYKDMEDMTPSDYAEEACNMECVDMLQAVEEGSSGNDHQAHSEPGADLLDESICEVFVNMVMECPNPDNPDLSLLQEDNLHHSLQEEDNESILPAVDEDTLEGVNPADDSDTTILIDYNTGSNSKGDHNDDPVGSPSSSSSSAPSTPFGSTPSPLTPSIPTPPTSCNYSSLTNEELRAKLIELGEKPGPINQHTRAAYLKYLDRIMQGVQPAGNQVSKGGYKYELALCFNGTVPVPDLHRRENSLFNEFRVKGQSKEYFNYLLIDPSRLASLDSTVLNDQTSDDDLFRNFVEATFYIGKGKNLRSLQHLKDAKKSSTNGSTTIIKSKKVQKILQIWESGEGILSLHVFNNIAAGEAFNREAAMIECIDLDNLTNVVKGHYHGSMDRCSASERRRLGLYFLYKSYKAFTIDTPRPIYPEDI